MKQSMMVMDNVMENGAWNGVITINDSEELFTDLISEEEADIISREIMNGKTSGYTDDGRRWEFIFVYSLYKNGTMENTYELDFSDLTDCTKEKILKDLRSGLRGNDSVNVTGYPVKLFIDTDTYKLFTGGMSGVIRGYDDTRKILHEAAFTFFDSGKILVYDSVDPDDDFFLRNECAISKFTMEVLSLFVEAED